MPGTAPTGFQTPKTDWTAANAPVAVDLNRIEGNAQATELGERTVDQAQTPTSSTGSLRQMLDWFASCIKAIKGTVNWYDAGGADAAATANRLALRDASADLTARRFISMMADGTPPLAVTSKTMVTNFNAEMLGGKKLAELPSSGAIVPLLTPVGLPFNVDTSGYSAVLQHRDANSSTSHVDHDGSKYPVKWHSAIATGKNVYLECITEYLGTSGHALYAKLVDNTGATVASFSQNVYSNPGIVRFEEGPLALVDGRTYWMEFYSSEDTVTIGGHVYGAWFIIR